MKKPQSFIAQLSSDKNKNNQVLFDWLSDISTRYMDVIRRNLVQEMQEMSVYLQVVQSTDYLYAKNDAQRQAICKQQLHEAGLWESGIDIKAEKEILEREMDLITKIIDINK